MAVAAKDRRFTRSRKTTVPDGLTEKPEPRSLRSSKAATSDLGKKGNCIVVISKLKSEITKNKEDSLKRRTPGRTRVNNEDENEVEEETKAKVTYLLCSAFFCVCVIDEYYKKVTSINGVAIIFVSVI